MDNIEKRKRFIINTAYWLLILGIIYFTFTVGIHYIMPFLIGFVIAMIVKPVIDWMERKLRMRRRLSATITVAFFYIVIGGLLALLIIIIVNQVAAFFAGFGTLYSEQIQPAIQQVVELLRFDLTRFDPEVAAVIQTAYDSISTMLSSTVDSLVNGIVSLGRGTITGVPGFFVNLMFTIVSTFFIASDYYNITGFIIRQMPEQNGKVVLQAKKYLGEVIIQYIRSYSMIMGITFVELLIGFWILGVKQLFLLAFIIAIFDILPVVGTGAVLAPWGIIMVLQGDYFLGFGLIIHWLIITVIRNIIEPKIVGDNVGLHPIVTLMSMYVGAKLFGGIGLFGLPISLAILTELNRRGAIDLFKRAPDSDDTEPEKITKKATRKTKRKSGEDKSKDNNVTGEE